MIWPILLAVGAAVATLLGGTLTLRARESLHLVTGASAGIVLGVASFDLLPEALRLAVESPGIPLLLALAATGCIIYLGLGRLLGPPTETASWMRRQLGPASLTLHSLLDGAGIGLAFQISPQLGWGVAVAVLGHDMADGVNIVGLSLGRGDRSAAQRWLVLNALAPVVGAAVGQVVRVPMPVFAILLAALAGIFVAIGAGELLPKSFSLGRRTSTTVAALAGLALVAMVVRLQG